MNLPVCYIHNCGSGVCGGDWREGGELLLSKRG